MNWFQRHLNWTCVLGYPLSLVVLFMVAWLVGMVGQLVGVTNPNFMEYTPLIVGAIAAIITLLVLTGWLLRQKGRSLWWLLLLPGIGWGLPTWLENKGIGSEVFDIKDGKLITRPRDEND